MASLLGALRDGDDAAYEKLVRSYGGRMLAVARRMLRNEDDAEEAVQEAFLSAFKAIQGFKGDARVGTWLHRIVVNASLMKLRSQKRRPESPIDELLPRFLEDGHAETPARPWRTESDPVEQAQTRERVRRAIGELPDNYRTVLLLRDIEELDTQETAEMLGITTNAVKIRLHRARQALREILDPDLREAS